MQAYIKNKAYYDKKVKFSKLKEAKYLYVLQPRADPQKGKNMLTEFWWTPL